MYSKNLLFIYFVFSFLSAVFINNILSNILLSILLFFFLSLILLNFYLYNKFKLILYLFIFIGFIFGLLISFFNIKNIENNFNLLSKYSYKKEDLIVKIENIYKIKKDIVEYKAKLYKIEDKNFSNKKIKLLINVPIKYKLEEGYIIKYKSKLYKIHNTSNFKFKEYLLSKDIYFKTYTNNLIIKSKDNVLKIKKIINKLRYNLLFLTSKIYTKDESDFLGGILFGARKELSNQLKINFNNSGLTHIIAVSGFNITILIIFFSYILKFIPMIFRSICIILSIIVFVLFVGYSAPVIRAAIMGILGYLLLISGRQNNTLSTLLLTLFIMIILSPLSLNYDISLHLSFLSVLGILYTQKFFNKIFFFLPNVLAIKEAFILTLSALVFTLPIVALKFGQISIIAPLANILVIWTIPTIMLLGFISIIIYYFFPFLGIIIGYFNWILLKYDILIVNFFGQFKYSVIKIDLGNIGIYLEFLYFIILIFLILYYKKQKS